MPKTVLPEKVFGAKVRDRRKFLGMTVGELSKILYLSTRTIWRIESGQIRCSVVTAFCIARALDCQVNDLDPLAENGVDYIGSEE